MVGFMSLTPIHELLIPTCPNDGFLFVCLFPSFSFLFVRQLIGINNLERWRGTQGGCIVCPTLEV